MINTITLISLLIVALMASSPFISLVSEESRAFDGNCLTFSPTMNPQSSLALNISTLNFHNMKFFLSKFSMTLYYGPITYESLTSSIVGKLKHKGINSC
jgi:hypothetical protein